jgi:hypothetical protein
VLGADASSPRPFPIDDIFEIEGIGMFYGGPYSFSPAAAGLVGQVFSSAITVAVGGGCSAGSRTT